MTGAAGVVARRAAVLGKPIAHSLSPVLHTAGYAATGLTDWAYTAIECSEAELPTVLGGLGPEWVGLSLTMPLKEVALALAHTVSPVATAVGAANTLVRRPDGAWYADNSDVPGLARLLRDAGAPAGAAVVVLGAGGTARAALAAAAELAAAEVTVLTRRAEAVEALRPAAEVLGVPLRVAPWPAAADWLDRDVVISTLPRGAADWLAPGARWGSRTVYCDALYDPWPTPLAASALAAGCRVGSGFDLLVAQAVHQFVWFTGIAAPEAAMRSALRAAGRG